MMPLPEITWPTLSPCVLSSLTTVEPMAVAPATPDRLTPSMTMRRFEES